MNNYTETSSYTVIQEYPRTGEPRDMGLHMGTSVLVRKFNPAIVPTGSWSELWVGMRCRFSSSYNYTSGSVFPWGYGMGLEFGICRSDGIVFGELGRHVNTSSQHTLGLQTDGRTFGEWNWYPLTSSHLKLSRVVSPVYRRGGTKFGTSGVTVPLGFANTGFDSESYFRSLLVLRFHTSSFVPTKFTMDLLYPLSHATASDASSSAMLADIMGAPSWTAALITASANGYRTTGELGTEAFGISQSVDGYFDGVFFTWGYMWENFEINDVAVRYTT